MLLYTPVSPKNRGDSMGVSGSAYPNIPEAGISVATVPGGDIAPREQRPHDDMWVPLWISLQEKARVAEEI